MQMEEAVRSCLSKIGQRWMPMRCSEARCCRGQKGGVKNEGGRLEQAKRIAVNGRVRALCAVTNSMG